MRALAKLILILLTCLLVSGPVYAQPYPKKLIKQVVAELGKKHYEKAIRLLKPEAEKGDVWAGFYLALAYEERGKPGDYELAVEWFRKGAETGHPQSQAFLGDMLRWGKGIEVDREEAEQWYTEALNQEVKEAERGLAILLTEDRKNLSYAVTLFRLAAAMGDDQSVHWLNGMVLGPSELQRDMIDTAFVPALCYLSIVQTGILVKVDEALAGNRPFGVNWQAPTGCVLNWSWSHKDHKWMVENLKPWLSDAREELVKTGFTVLPKQIDVTLAGDAKSCPSVRSKKSKPQLTQDGPDLKLSNVAGENYAGAIVENHIVLSTGMSLEDEYRMTRAFVTVVHGDWDGSQAILKDTMETCTVTLKAARPK